jgi:hypothetical protein
VHCRLFVTSVKQHNLEHYFLILVIDKGRLNASCVENSRLMGREAVSLGLATWRNNRVRGPEFLICGRAPINVAALVLRLSLLH